MNSNLYLMVIGMCLVTYIPRLLPLLFMQQIKLPAFLERFLRFIPFAALGSLVFPQVFFSAGVENWFPATIATIVCMVLAWFRINVVIVVLAGIAVTFFVTKAPLPW
ncbi:AzlD domain-containing protein [Shimazuella kribbensis]|uniref:AzlD domain-containing protein n=1 Tax=Shimazuella kribbensis TaxID=139808 RepID=UPI00040E3EF8|nr:AzlD domain-containing protein [Shimazuella kribbensis]